MGFRISKGWTGSSSDDGGYADADPAEIVVAASCRQANLYLGLASVVDFGEVQNSGFEAKADYEIALVGLTLPLTICGQWV